MQLSAAVPEKAVENGQELAPMWKAQKKLLNFGAEPALFQPLQLFGMVSELTHGRHLSLSVPVIPHTKINLQNNK